MRFGSGIRLALAAALVLAPGCASAPKTKVGWDQNVTFANYHTWAWKPDGSINDPTWARRCQDVLSDQLQSDGLTQVTLDRNPDLWGVMHVRLSAETVVTPFDPNWGYAWGAWAPVDDYETQIPVGTIIVDLVDPRLKQIVWRGRAKDAIDPSLSNEGREEKLRGVLAQLFAGYPPPPEDGGNGFVTVSPLAGRPAPSSLLVDVPKLVTAYYTGRPDPAVPAQRVAFGTSGHRGSSFDDAFNEAHILAITEAICRHRRAQNVDGPLFLGIDTHALSAPAFATALEVLAAHEVEVRVDADGGYTPTPVVSHAILTHNRGRGDGLADGIVITPSHNPPRYGGFKYNPVHGGPADADVTAGIEKTANALLADACRAVRRVPYERARRAPTTKPHPFRQRYVDDLGAVVDCEAIRASGIRIGADPLGGASVAYWDAIRERWGLNLDVVNREVDATFRFMTVDWDGQIRMDPSSPPAMASLVALKDRYDVAFANDADADRHGVVTKGQGLLEPNHYLSAAIAYLFAERPHWPAAAAVGKTLVSSGMIDRVAKRLGRKLVEVPVGFKWFVDGLLSGALGFGGEESAGASFLRRDGTAWTTDKDGIAPNLLAAEITARTGKDPGERYRALTEEFGAPCYTRIDAPATPEQKEKLKRLSPESVDAATLAGDPIRGKLTRAPGNGAPIGGLKVVSDTGWFAARPSGTENIYKIYAESFRDRTHLEAIVAEAQHIVGRALVS